MNVLAVQFDIVWEDKPANFARVRALLEQHSPEPGSLVVLPEMFATGFSLNLAATRQDEGRPEESFLADLARQYHCTIVAGLINGAPGDRGFNQAVAFSGDDGALLARYTKIHPFSLGGETTCHAAGTEIVTFAYGGFTIAPFVCYDLRFPEIFRAAAARGANVFTVLALWPVKRQQHWLTLLQARAIENQAYVIGVNRVGTEPQYQYAGRSVVIDPHGIIVADAGESEGVVAGRIERHAVETWRREFPALRDAHWNCRA